MRLLMAAIVATVWLLIIQALAFSLDDIKETRLEMTKRTYQRLDAVKY